VNLGNGLIGARTSRGCVAVETVHDAVVRDDPLGLAAPEQLVAAAEARAAHAWRHAEGALDQARRDAAQGDREAERLHVREAKAHNGAARVSEQTAALDRRRGECRRNRVRVAEGRAMPTRTHSTIDQEMLSARSEATPDP
jgi:hypothetical protein